NVPSAQVKAGDVVAVREKAKKQLRIQNAVELAKHRKELSWIDVKTDSLEGTMKSSPDRSELSADKNVQLIIELYSQ
ncbi:30S ribosomal protein S4, partial [Francisella tularensis subsp. holarctica]|nr:30S ribosomal protein S4 [Francisella tularensis subsp. holarctica]